MSTRTLHVRWKKPVDYLDYNPFNVRCTLSSAGGQSTSTQLSDKENATFTGVPRGYWIHCEVWYYTPQRSGLEGSNMDPAVIQSRSAAIDFYLP